MDPDIEFVEEEVAGGIMKLPATRWRNVTGTPVRMDLHMDGPRWADATERKMIPARVVRVVIAPGEENLVPSMLDKGVQDTYCGHPDCAQRPRDCRSAEEGHEKQVVGGLDGGRLVRVGPRIAPRPPEVACGLKPAPPSIAPQSIDERLLLRARRGVV
jgi:hypothetical protein